MIEEVETEIRIRYVYELPWRNVCITAAETQAEFQHELVGLVFKLLSYFSPLLSIAVMSRSNVTQGSGGQIDRQKKTSEVKIPLYAMQSIWALLGVPSCGVLPCIQRGVCTVQRRQSSNTDRWHRQCEWRGSGRPLVCPSPRTCSYHCHDTSRLYSITLQRQRHHHHQYHHQQQQQQRQHQQYHVKLITCCQHDHWTRSTAANEVLMFSTISDKKLSYRRDSAHRCTSAVVMPFKVTQGHWCI